MNNPRNNQTLPAACGMIQKHVDKLAKHLRWLDQTDDIEQIHQARVTCRRLRQSLIFFEDCFDLGQMKEWEKATKRLLRRLGRARDLDIHADFLEAFMDKLDTGGKKVLPGLKRLLLRIRQRRRLAQDEVLSAVTEFQRKKVLVGIHLQTEKVLSQSPRTQSAERNILRQRIQKRLEFVYKLMKEKEQSLNDPQDTGGHHALRIAVKRFRYTLEIADYFYGGALNSFVKTAQKFQGLLGDLHDCIVWQELLEAFADDEKERIMEFCGHDRPYARLKPGIEYLRQDRKRRAEELYRQACDCVDSLNSRNLWPQVFEIISNQPLGGSGEPKHRKS